MAKNSPLNRSVATRPSTGTLALLVLLGAATAGWSVFLWLQLIQARSGGTPFCGFGGPGDCKALWDGAFASAIQRFTGLPLAAWGVVWGVVAAGLAFAARLRRQRDEGVERHGAALKILTLGGLVGVLVFGTVSFQAGEFCFGCFVTYVLVGLFAVVYWRGFRAAPLAPLGRGVTWAVLGTLGAYLLLLVPGLKTPKSQAEAGREALAAVAAASAATSATPTPAPVSPAPSPEVAPEVAVPPPPAAGPLLFDGPATGDAQRDRALETLVAGLSGPDRQMFSNFLYAYMRAPVVPAEKPRAVVGPATAPVRITAFSDVLCSHCAELAETLQGLRGMAPVGSFQIEERFYPLDASCNPQMQRSDPAALRCLGAKAAICLEGKPEASEFLHQLFRNQERLTADMVYDFAAPYVDAAALARCVADPATAAKLASDITWAGRHGIQGTPLVLVNGRRSPREPRLLYALVLTGGKASHPSFRELPPPDPAAF
ncbi:MAG: thioredoxin domain-containing protein [Thermoanaerobaculia bacterium]|nr:thioredoxin domain-containing protein [Thermoanaerobaculia bacterium]